MDKRVAAVVVLKTDETRKTIGDKNNTGALLDKSPGTIEPLAYVRGLCRVALAAGVRVFTQSEVIAASDTGSRWRNGAATGSANAEWVIIATDAYGKGPWSQIRQEQIHCLISILPRGR
ncbi:glycine/D-amino acid oxidase-like deaminating enzyme [Bradyrhizobium niftali]|uniref:FAD-dependent oxidoreductase n=1 Tax=Bradyrhizobium niftali TaxID=2560055 RepID=UPI00383444F0